MKQLTKFILIAFLCSFYAINTSAQRMQFLNDTMAIDTRGAMAKGEYSLHPFFDKYGMWYYHDAAPADNVEIGKTSDGNKIAILIEPKQSGAFKWDQYFSYINGWMLKGFEGKDRETPYGITRYVHFLPPGEHIINAWQTEHIRYSGNDIYDPDNSEWRIPESTSDGCKCAFTNNPGDFVEFTFSGRGIEVIGENLPTHGSVQVEVDYKDYGTINTFSNDTIEDVTIFKVSNMDSRQHTIRLTKVQEDGYFVLHRFIVTDEREDIPQPHITDTVYIDYPDERPYYDTLTVNPDTLNTVLIDSHNELTKALQTAISSGGKEIVRKGYFQVRKREDGTIFIIQPNYEVK